MKHTFKKKWPLPVKTLVAALAGAGLVSLPFSVLANPSGAQVVAGNITIRQESPTKLGITQTTDKGIIDWQKYSIGANEHVQYYQPSASSVTLNRVVGQDPSQILGRLTANGQVFLVNPNGIYFGKNAQIDVAGLVASTHNIRNEDFLAGKYNFNIPGKPGAAVINEGTIRIADTGVAAFVAPSVANRGVIVARLGKVAMAAANGFTLDFHGDQLLSFLVKDDVAQTAFDLDGKQLTSFVENSGRIEAQGGYVLLTAKAAENAIHGVINHSGVIEATTVGTKNGEIILNAGTGSLQVSGTLDASAPNGGNGGFIETSGAQLYISPEIKISTLAASGNNGTWLIDPFNILVGTGGISPTALNTATSNIILEATNDITFQSAVNVAQAGVGLTAKAGRNIQVDANISTNNGEINLLAGFDSFTNAAGVNDGKVIINGARVNSGTAARNIIGRGPSTDGLVGFWTFDGNAKDGSGNANNGSSLGNVTFTSDGTRDIVKFGGIYSPGSVLVTNNSSLQFSSNMTLSYWVRIDSTVGMNGYGQAATIGSVGTTVAKSHDRSGFFSLMGTGSNGEYYSTFGNDVYRSTSAGVSSLTGESTASSVGHWVHVAYTFSANEAKIYINGALKSSVSRPINFSVANTQNLYFGKFSDSWYPLNGALDEVRLYNQTLSSDRISEIYSGATPPVTPPPGVISASITLPEAGIYNATILSSVSYAESKPQYKPESKTTNFIKLEEVSSGNKALDVVMDAINDPLAKQINKTVSEDISKLVHLQQELNDKASIYRNEINKVDALVRDGKISKDFGKLHIYRLEVARDFYMTKATKIGEATDELRLVRDPVKIGSSTGVTALKYMKSLGNAVSLINAGVALNNSWADAIEISNKSDLYGLSWDDFQKKNAENIAGLLTTFAGSAAPYLLPAVYVATEARGIIDQGVALNDSYMDTLSNIEFSINQEASQMLHAGIKGRDFENSINALRGAREKSIESLVEMRSHLTKWQSFVVPGANSVVKIIDNLLFELRDSDKLNKKANYSYDQGNIYSELYLKPLDGFDEQFKSISTSLERSINLFN